MFAHLVEYVSSAWRLTRTHVYLSRTNSNVWENPFKLVENDTRPVEQHKRMKTGADKKPQLVSYEYRFYRSMIIRLVSFQSCEEVMYSCMKS